MEERRSEIRECWKKLSSTLFSLAYVLFSANDESHKQTCVRPNPDNDCDICRVQNSICCMNFGAGSHNAPIEIPQTPNTKYSTLKMKQIQKKSATQSVSWQIKQLVLLGINVKRG